MQYKIIAAIAAKLNEYDTLVSLYDVEEMAKSIAAAIAPLVEAGEADWKDAPEWAEYKATDWNGLSHWFEAEPYQHNSGCWMNQKGTKYQKIYTSEIGPYDKSLQRRPQ